MIGWKKAVGGGGGGGAVEGNQKIFPRARQQISISRSNFQK